MVALADIEAYAHEIARRFKPKRIILFGSYTDGEPDDHSDVDLLVVIADGGDPLGKAMEISRALPHYGFALDLIVRDPEVLQRRIEQHDWFLIEITEKGRVLYEAQHQRVG